MHSVHLDSAEMLYVIYRDKSDPIQRLTFYSLYVAFC